MAEKLEMNFCRRCGAGLSKAAGNGHECPNGHTIFENPSPCVGIFFVTADQHVYLSERGIQPHKGMLDAFGGFVDSGDESLETATERELQEELSLAPGDYEPLRYLTSATSRYPYEGEDLEIMSILYWTRLKGTHDLKPSDDVAAVRKLPLHAVPFDDLHADDIRIGIRVLQRMFPQGAKENQYV
ncbi:MAG TPA: NUDIX domain-containing protein [Candidatus Saccharimonadales bacterium]|nr:NUDIX domain-containing protein [Candidatus Saccharimonadales bacterium]